VQLIADQDVAEVSPDLFPILTGFADASNGGPPPALGSQEQVVLWDDGRALITRAVSADLASLLIQGRPAGLDSAVQITAIDPAWSRVSAAGLQGVLASGVYQLGTYPISNFLSKPLPSGSRIRFADPAFTGV
jgi:hypothetical protein